MKKAGGALLGAGAASFWPKKNPTPHRNDLIGHIAG